MALSVVLTAGQQSAESGSIQGGRVAAAALLIPEEASQQEGERLCTAPVLRSLVCHSEFSDFASFKSMPTEA
jgi:hypothetical protein